MAQNQNVPPTQGQHTRNQSSVLNTHQNQQTSLQLQAQALNQGSIQIGARSVQNANG